jgi:hypothetical protein
MSATSAHNDVNGEFLRKLTNVRGAIDNVREPLQWSKNIDRQLLDVTQSLKHRTYDIERATRLHPQGVSNHILAMKEVEKALYEIGRQ